MKQLTKYILSFSLLFLSGCWDQNELTEFVFVQSLAVDQTKDGNIKLTTQFYKPSPKIASSGGGGDVSFVNIETEGKTMFDAIRDITIHIGRKAHWGHVRFIVMSDKVAKKNIAQMLEFFYRDHEPRLLTGFAITKGKASDYLQTKPHIENTISEQLNEATKSGGKFSGKAYPTNLYTLGKQIHSETQTAYAPLLSKDSSKNNMIIIDGLAIFHKAKLKQILSNKDTKYLMLVMKEFQSGIIELPCPKSDLKESYEVLDVQTKTSVSTKRDGIHYKIEPKLQMAIGEMQCTTIEDRSHMEELNKKLEKQIDRQIHDLLKKSQKKNTDIIGLGNAIYHYEPEEWDKIKKEKKPYYKTATIHVKTKVNVVNTGTDIGIPFSPK
ncbi:Ger(x)C family spore germination protein [Fictibacillus nanhaiensis]|uniref:Ger(x)C family spore germination protein n=1 Tax=Fictibacillus nanhaiensis TaxID=742169 RepID=UPI001C974BCE|nr:Ger(x)C family spore germination protein [Fictibacillus nanhaiensis]MBY6038029.1 Ger(x)C family spore germination protein [Fictibacillus nanhaiensis]